MSLAALETLVLRRDDKSLVSVESGLRLTHRIELSNHIEQPRRNRYRIMSTWVLRMLDLKIISTRHW